MGEPKIVPSTIQEHLRIYRDDFIACDDESKARLAEFNGLPVDDRLELLLGMCTRLLGYVPEVRDLAARYQAQKDQEALEAKRKHLKVVEPPI